MICTCLMKYIILLSAALCPDLMDPANGKVTISGNSDGDSATYSCDPGYELVGTETVICQSDGQWSDPPPVCQIIGKYDLMCNFNNNIAQVL